MTDILKVIDIERMPARLRNKARSMEATLKDIRNNINERDDGGSPAQRRACRNIETALDRMMREIE